MRAYAIVLVPVSETGTASPFHHACRVKLMWIACFGRCRLALDAVRVHVVRVVVVARTSWFGRVLRRDV